MSATQSPQSVCDLLPQETREQLDRLAPLLPSLPSFMLQEFANAAREHLRLELSGNDQQPDTFPDEVVADTPAVPDPRIGPAVIACTLDALRDHLEELPDCEERSKIGDLIDEARELARAKFCDTQPADAA